MKTKSRELLDRFDQVLSSVHRDAASGELDGSGRFYTDEELVAGAATGKKREAHKPEDSAEEPAA